MARINGTVFWRFLAKIQVSETLSWNGTPCWIWTAGLDISGYGELWIGPGKSQEAKAHRVSREIFKGAIPQGLECDHLCRNRSCVNPDHIEPVTRQVNFQRGDQSPLERGRALLQVRLKAITHCPQGHEYTLANTHLKRGRARSCRQCARDYAKRKWRERHPLKCLQDNPSLMEP